MTEGGCSGEEEGSNCDDVAVGAGAGVAGFMMASESRCEKVPLEEGCRTLEAELEDGIKYPRLEKGFCSKTPLLSVYMHETVPLDVFPVFTTFQILCLTHKPRCKVCSPPDKSHTTP